MLVVGRAVTSDNLIYDPTICRTHAEIAVTAGGVKLKDLGSSNGTFLNGARVTEAEAGENDIVTFGKVAFKVISVTPPAPRPQVVPAPPEFAGSKQQAGRGTIVRQMPHSKPGGVPALAIDAPRGASHLGVSAQSQQERRGHKLSVQLE